MTAHNKFYAITSIFQGRLNLRIIRFEDLAATPWKNGGGITREIAALRKNEQTLWRISMADVENNGPFSEFKGLTRILTILQGNGLRLMSSERVMTALLGMPVRFDGGLAVQSELINGKVRDLNVMFDGSLFDAKVEIATKPRFFDKGEVTAVIGLSGTSIIDGLNQISFCDTALSEGEAVDLKPGDHAAAIVVGLKSRR